MKTLIDFSKTPCIIEVTDEEFADYERRNASEIKRRRIMREHDEAQALYNARLEEREKWQDIIAEKDALIVEKDAQIAELIAKLEIQA